jgi:hypothetical protein
MSCYAMWGRQNLLCESKQINFPVKQKQSFSKKATEFNVVSAQYFDIQFSNKNYQVLKTKPNQTCHLGNGIVKIIQIPESLDVNFSTQCLWRGYLKCDERIKGKYGINDLNNREFQWRNSK